MYRLIGASCIALLVGCGDNGRPPAPSLSDVSATTAEDTKVLVRVPLTAFDVAAVTLSIVTPPTHGTFTGAGPSWTYMPAANYNGADSAVVKAEDSYGSSTAMVAITVTPVNDAPVANPDSFSAAFGVPLTIPQATLLANDTDVDGQTLTVVSVAADSHGTPVKSGSDVVFTPEAGFAGAAKFVYTISDGQATAQGVVNVTVGDDQPPSAVADTATTDEDITATIADTTLLANDTDPENHTLAVSSVGNAVHGTVSHAGAQVTFVPDANYNGPASFDYTITDGTLTSTAKVTITVNAVDDPPVAVDDSATVGESALATTIDVLANDTDIDGGPKTVAAVGAPAHGSAAVAAGGAAISYSSGIGYCNGIPNGARDTFTYTLSPGGSTATVSVTVTCACGLKKSTDFVVGSN